MRAEQRFCMYAEHRATHESFHHRMLFAHILAMMVLVMFKVTLFGIP